jgi:hypothetical protein
MLVPCVHTVRLWEEEGVLKGVGVEPVRTSASTLAHPLSLRPSMTRYVRCLYVPPFSVCSCSIKRFSGCVVMSCVCVCVFIDFPPFHLPRSFRLTPTRWGEALTQQRLSRCGRRELGLSLALSLLLSTHCEAALITLPQKPPCALPLLLPARKLIPPKNLPPPPPPPPSCVRSHGLCCEM